MNFLRTGYVQTYHVSGCNMAGGTGFFYSGNGAVVIDGCGSMGYIESQGARVEIRGSIFGNPNYMTAGSAANYSYVDIVPQRIITHTETAYTIAAHEGSAKLRFNNASPQTVTLAKNSDGTVRLGAGTKIEVQRIGTGLVTFAGAPSVTISSSNGLKLRAQYSCATLTCDGSDLWTLSGDTAP